MELASYKESIKQKLLHENQFYDIAGFGPAPLQPKSKGYVTIRSSSSHVDPIIQPGYFEHPDDMETTIETFKSQVSYENTNVFRSRGGQFLHIPIEECDQYEFRSHDYYRCYIQYFSSTAHHLVGTSKMGPTSDPEAVVDPRLRIKNIGNSRQIDASM